MTDARNGFRQGVRQPGVAAALGAAALFGAGTPASKWLLGSVDPWMLAGLLYLGSGLGLTLYRWLVRSPDARLDRHEWPWLIGAIAAGGALAPALLMLGLTRMPASEASLLLNAEGVLTALLAWFVFKENFDRRIALGMLAIVLGAVTLSWPEQLQLESLWPALAVLGACLCWALDNNLTRKVSLADAAWLASIKGLAAGTVNLSLSLMVGASLPALPTLAGAMGVGLLAYGISLVMFIIGLRHLGTARSGAYFSVAPFFGAALAILLLDEPTSARLLIAGTLMAFGVWLHLTEDHGHEHVHDTEEHDHEHRHDDGHHQHDHESPVAPNAKHMHRHRHLPLRHVHAHVPDMHHRHDH